MSTIAPAQGGRNSLADNRHVFGHCDLSINGRLTDMVNKSRARDAALSLALGLLNRNAEETRSGDPSVEKNAATHTEVGGDGEWREWPPYEAAS